MHAAGGGGAAGAERAVVMDLGSGTTKWGFAGDAVPQSKQPSLVDVRSSLLVCKTLHSFLQYFFQGKRYKQQGIVTSKELLEKMLHNAFYNHLRVAPEDHSLLCFEHLFK